MTNSHPPEVREEAVRRVVEGDSTKGVARAMNLAQSTVSKWCRDAGVVPTTTKKLAVEGARLRWEQVRVELAHDMGQSAQKVLAKTMSKVNDDKLREAQSGGILLGILIDKAQLLTGAATSRSEHSPSEIDAEIKKLVAELKGRGKAG